MGRGDDEAVGDEYRSVRDADPQLLVDSGPFAYTRNPLYLSMTLAYAGIATWRRAPVALALLPALLVVVQRGVIEREERYLEKKFGERYLAYKSRVRRWL